MIRRTMKLFLEDYDPKQNGSLQGLRLQFALTVFPTNKQTKIRLLLQQGFHSILHLLLAVLDTMWQKCIWDIKQ